MTTTMLQNRCEACGAERESITVPLPESMGGPRTLWNCPACAKSRSTESARANPIALRSIVNELSRVPEEFAAVRVKDHPDAGARQIGFDYVTAVPKPLESLLGRREWRGGGTPEQRLELLAEARHTVKGVPGLAIVGKIGRGKTGLAAAILNALRGFGIPGVLVNVEELMRAVQGTYGRGGARLESILDPLVRAPLLVLDDLDKIHGSKDQLLKLYGIVNARKEARLPIIVTSKMTANELAGGPFAAFGSVGEDIIDRLVQIAPSWKILESDHSYRMESLGL
jgi:hypothetical protein